MHKDSASLPQYQRLSVEQLLGRLDGVRRAGTGRWSARCPAHTDRTPSLSVRQGDEGLLLFCFSGCDFTQIVTALGLVPSQLFDPRPGPLPRPPRRDLRAEQERRVQALWRRLTNRIPPPERLKAELVLLGGVIIGGPAAYRRAVAANPELAKPAAEPFASWACRILWQAVEETAQEKIPRTHFSTVEMQRRIDAAAQRPGYYRERQLHRVFRLAARIAIQRERRRIDQ